MKNCTKLFLMGLVSLVVGMMPAKSWAVERLTNNLKRCNNSNAIANISPSAILNGDTPTSRLKRNNRTYSARNIFTYAKDSVQDVLGRGTFGFEFTLVATEESDTVWIYDLCPYFSSYGYISGNGYNILGGIMNISEDGQTATITCWDGQLMGYKDATFTATTDGSDRIPLVLNIIDGGDKLQINNIFGVIDSTGWWSAYPPTEFDLVDEDWEGDDWEEWGEYIIDVPSPGQLSHLLLNKIDQWTDVKSLTLTGSLNADDLAVLSRLTEMSSLDLSQTDITSMTGCRGLSNLACVILPSSVKRIDDYAFYECSNLYYFGYDENWNQTTTLPDVVEVGDYAFFKTRLRSIELPKAETIGAYAFARAEEYGDSFSGGLIDIQIPRVTRIGAGAFLGCANLDNVSIPSAKTICDYAFCNCFDLSEIDLSNVDSLGRGTFYMYTERYGYLTPSLSSVTLSEHLSTIPRACFSQCTVLQNIELPSSLRVIEQSAFYECPLTSISFPEGLQIIGPYAFYNCPLEYIELPEGLHTIEYDAFYNCPLTSISIPSTINSISGAFGHEYGKGSQVSRIYSYAVQPFATSAFSEMTSATLIVPAFSLNAYRMHDDWYHFASIVPMDGDLEKLHFNSDFTIYDYKGLSDKVDMTLAYKTVNGESWESYSVPAHLTVNANSTFTLGEYIQYQDLYNRTSSYDYDLGQYIYTYPYCTTLITQNEITADKMCTNVSMRDGRWNFISFPYDVNVSEIVVPEGVLWVIRKYSGADRAAMTGNTWQNMTEGMVLKAGEGYIFHCYNEEDDEVCVSFPSSSNDAGTLFAYDDVVKTLSEYPSEYAHNRSWNLVGNPYPSYFNIQEIEFDAPITVWNGEGYTAYSLLDDNYVLTPNEAFFVQRPINAATMTFHKEGRMHELESASESYAPSFTRTRNASAARFVYNFLLADGSYTDRARLVVNEEAKAEYEVNCDASKFMSSNADVPQLYINDGGVKYAIDERPLGNGVINLGAYFGKAGEHTISLASNPNEKVAVMLTDRLTGTVANLSMDSYTFTAEAGASDDRFVIALARTTDIENSVIGEEPITEIYTLDGKLVTDTNNLPAGVYLVKKGGEYVKHVITE